MARPGRMQAACEGGNEAVELNAEDRKSRVEASRYGASANPWLPPPNEGWRLGRIYDPVTGIGTRAGRRFGPGQTSHPSWPVPEWRDLDRAGRAKRVPKRSRRKPVERVAKAKTRDLGRAGRAKREAEAGRSEGPKPSSRRPFEWTRAERRTDAGRDEARRWRSVSDNRL